ncbi:NUDIX hydrolase [Prevotella sp. KH2C16]|uniref:NUDIX hydrolase n=1 Tax=Prevotella sp. KH2C16 TaxID=1855325 RepID=UPI0008F26FDD|nr:NUDIX hydrolase [Prevotella sp. KH2C16]SFG42220.1 8-oxo-dGTP pyrophosphatase MutT, NUDIX family [Prevotella sp. KH2C16]
MEFRDEEMKWKVRSREKLFERPWLTVHRDEVELPDGRVNGEYYVLHYPAWVNVIAETDDGRLILERQYRHGLGTMSTEICAGVVEKGEEPLAAARRELLEETGYGGGEWTLLMTTAPNAGSMDNLCHSYLARGVRQVSQQHLDRTEDIKVYLFEREEVLRMLKAGEFLQAMMVAPLWKYFSQHTSLLE